MSQTRTSMGAWTYRYLELKGIFADFSSPLSQAERRLIASGPRERGMAHSLTNWE